MLVLGPVALGEDDDVVPLRSARRRSLLAALVARVGRMVPTDRLAEAVWPSGPPPTAAAALQVHLAELRSALEPRRGPRDQGSFVSTLPEGYRLDLRVGQLDAARFVRLVEAGRRLRALGAHDDAIVVLQHAIAGWRGPAYADCRDAVPDEARWLEGTRLDVEDDLATSLVAAGHHGRAVPELERLLEAEPHRERRAALFVLALYRNGRQAEALSVLARVRRRLVEELGCEPGPELRRLEQAVLAHDPALERLVLEPRGLAPAPTPRGDGCLVVSGPRPAVAVAAAALGGPPLAPSGCAEIVGDRRGLELAVDDELALPGSPLRDCTLSWAGTAARRSAPPAVGTRADASVVATRQLVGRDAERRRLERLIADGGPLSVTGPPGVGKTALVADVVARVVDPGRLRWVDCADLPTGLDPVEALVDHLGVRTSPIRSPAAGLTSVLSDMVLVLDDHDVLADVDDLVALLTEDPTSTCILVGRRRAHLPGVPVLAVQPLPPAAGDRPTSDQPAVRLLLERAGVADHEAGTPAELAELVRRLDGLPLALELAAPLVRTLGAAAVTARLDSSTLAPLREGVAHAGPGGVGSRRHRSLDAAITWSYRHLSPEAARLLERAAVFAGPFSLDDLEAVCVDELLAVDVVASALAELVDAALLVPTPSDDGLLHRPYATVRAVARQRLDASGEEPAVRARHAAHVAGVLRRTGHGLLGPSMPRARRRVERSVADLHLALEWQSRNADPDEQLTLLASLGFFWAASGRLAEGARVHRRALARGGGGEARGRCLVTTAFLEWWLGDLRRLRPLLVEIVDGGGPVGPRTALCAACLAVVDGDLDQAATRAAEAVAAARAGGREWELASTAAMAGNIAWYRGDASAAVGGYGEAAAIGARLGNPLITVLGLRGQALNLALDGRVDVALALAGEALALAERLGDPLTLGQASTFAGLVRLERGETVPARALLADAAGLAAEGADLVALVLAGCGWTAIASGDGDVEAAATVEGWLDAVLAFTGLPLPPRERQRRAAAAAACRRALGEARCTVLGHRGRSLQPHQLAHLLASGQVHTS